jgi:hypothetical protein
MRVDHKKINTFFCFHFFEFYLFNIIAVSWKNKMCETKHGMLPNGYLFPEKGECCVAKVCLTFFLARLADRHEALVNRTATW